MSESNKPIPAAETQQQRWVKYGANVAIVSIVVIVLAGLIGYLAQRYHWRMDTTSAGMYSLKPQTIAIIKNNTQPVKIVSLYTRTQRGRVVADDDAPKIDHVQVVSDLLEEYKRKGSKIDVEIIDPVEQPTKVDQLIDEVTNKYGGEVQKYRGLVDDYLKKDGVYDQVQALASAEAKLLEKLPLEQVQDEDLQQTLYLAAVSVQGFPKRLESYRRAIEKVLKEKPPAYKAAVDAIDDDLSSLGELAGGVIDRFGAAKDDQKVPAPIRAYIAESLPRFEQMKKLCDDLAKRAKELGELKLDDLRQSLRVKKDPILVMGPNEMRVIEREKVWQIPPDVRGYTSEGRPRERFAGEQQITSAILAVTATTKPRVVFVRPGGPPLTSPGMPPFMRSGDLSAIADRLRDYNFEVLERDVSGMWAAQAAMQQMPSGPEATDEQMKDAVWIVAAFPAQRRQPMMGQDGQMAAKVSEHMERGGAVLVLAVPDGDNLAPALDPWGVNIRTDAIAVHEKVPEAGGPNADIIEEALRSPPLFVLREFGDHPLARPLKSLDLLAIVPVIVEKQNKPGISTAPLLPIPQTLKVWGETNLGFLRAEDAPMPTYDPPKSGEPGGDLAPPLMAGIAAQRDAGGRLVVLGVYQSITDGILRSRWLFDPKLAQNGVYVFRFPANAELFCNSVFWLAKMEPMIAISPSAMEVSRIRDMKRGVLNTWRTLVVAGLPLLVIAAGALMYIKRKD